MPNGQSKGDNPEKLAPQGTLDDEKQNKNVNTTQASFVTNNIIILMIIKKKNINDNNNKKNNYIPYL